MKVDGIDALFTSAPDAFVVELNAAHAHPDRFRDFEDRLERLAQAVPTQNGLHLFSMSVPVRHDLRLAKLSYLRAAYLAAFAHFGYRYAMGEAFEKVRIQVASPDQELIDIVPVAASDAGTGFGFLDHPRIGPTLLVGFGRWVVALPARPTDEGWWARMAAESNRPPVVSPRMTPIAALPAGPRHLMDMRQAPTSRYGQRPVAFPALP